MLLFNQLKFEVFLEPAYLLTLDPIDYNQQTQAYLLLFFYLELIYNILWDELFYENCRNVSLVLIDIGLRWFFLILWIFVVGLSKQLYIVEQLDEVLLTLDRAHRWEHPIKLTIAHLEFGRQLPPETAHPPEHAITTSGLLLDLLRILLHGLLDECYLFLVLLDEDLEERLELLPLEDYRCKVI